MRRPERLHAIQGLFAAVVLVAACGGGATTSTEEYLASGDAFAKDSKWAEAIIQYRNAIAADPQLGQARFKLAVAYERSTDLPAAMAEYVRAADLMPDDTTAQLEAARFLLLARRFDDARSRADSVLGREPNNVNALIARATALAGLKDVAGGIAEVEEAIKVDPANAASYMMLGAMQVSQRNVEEAEASFKRAVEADPKSIEAQQALAAFYWSSRRLPLAEEWLRKAVATDPTNLGTQRALTTFLMTLGRVAEAEGPLKTVAEATKAPAAELALADYYLSQRRFDEARPILVRLSKTDQGFIPATVRLAQLDYGLKRPELAHQGLKAVLAKDPKQVDALVMQAQMFLTERKSDEALAAAQAAVANTPQAAGAHNVLGDALATRNEPDAAIRAYNDTLRINPRLVGAKLKIAQLQIQKGDFDGALQSTEDVVRQSPSDPFARMLRARALTARGDLSRALSDLEWVAKEYPKAAPVRVQLAELHLARKDRPAARKAFDEAIALAPDSIAALRGRVFLDLVDNRGAQARQSVEKQLQRFPKSSALLFLAAGVYAATNEPGKQEQVLNRLIEVDPNNLQAFAALASFHLRQGKLDQARAKYEALSTRGVGAVAAKTMVGLILEAQDKPAEATAIYEKLLATDPDSAVAANNLAWRYAEDGGNLDVALTLAQTAKRKLPDSPEISDTLGWIHLKKLDAGAAVTAFQTSVKANPKSPGFRYHLGMAYAKSGEKEKAALEFDEALKLQPNFKEAVEARRALVTGG
jgi:putative PEP-CTERM system TPR-repeat lipoprotein